ncbi:MAG: uracil-DNA glycosylase [Sulfurovum sp.]
MKNLKNALLLKHLYQIKNLGYRYSSLRLYEASEPDFKLFEGLDSIEKEAKDCHLCRLSKSRKRVIFGDGNKSANVMFVGDFPSNSDESVGRVFTSKVGDLLTKMIESVLLIPKDKVYFTNILKCRPLDTINPSPTYAHTCMPYLLKEIELINPQIVVVLGEITYHYLTGENKKIEEIRGEKYSQNGYIIIPTHHPRDILKNASLKREIFEDLKIIKGELDLCL